MKDGGTEILDGDFVQVNQH